MVGGKKKVPSSNISTVITDGKALSDFFQIGGDTGIDVMQLQTNVVQEHQHYRKIKKLVDTRIPGVISHQRMEP